MESHCEVYHDEVKDSRKNPIAHGFLIVPLRSKEILIRNLDYFRNKNEVQDFKINFKNLSGQKWSPLYSCARDWLDCAIEAMANKNFRDHITNQKMEESLGLRFCAIFMKSLKILSDDYWQWYDGGEKTIKKFETLMRIGIKGGLHYLYSVEHPVKIVRFVTDAGAFHRALDNKRIINRLKFESNHYVNLAQVESLDSCVSDHRRSTCHDVDAANLLQLCDLILGSVSFCCFKGNHPMKLKATENIRQLLDKRKRGKDFKYSRHFKTFSISTADIVGGSWVFNNLTTKLPNLPAKKLSLFS